MNKIKKIITTVAIFASTLAFSQVGIGTNTPSVKSILDLTATDKGFLLPRMTTAQRIAISPTATTDKSLQVFDTTTNTIWFWNGTVWVEQGAKNIYDSNGDVSPTAVVNRTVTFTNGGSLNFDANTLFVDATNNRVGIGTTLPSASLSAQEKVLIGTLATSITSDPIIKLTGTNWNRIGGGGANSALAFWGNGNSNADNTPQMFIQGSTGNIGISTTSPNAKLEINSGALGVSGLRFTNFNSSTPIGIGQTIGVDAFGNIITMGNAVPATAFTIENSTVIGTDGAYFNVNDLSWSLIPNTSQVVTIPTGGKALFINFMLGIDYGANPSGSGFAYYTAALHIDGIITNVFQTVQEHGINGLQSQFNLSSVKFLTPGDHIIDVRMKRTYNNGTTSGENMACVPISVSINSSYLN